MNKNYIPQTKKTASPKVNAQIQHTTQEVYTGPIPHPDILKGFAEIDSSFPERIIKMAEKHNESNVLQKNRISWSNAYLPLIGQIFTFILAISGILFGVFLAIKGHTSSSITSIIGGFCPILIAAISNLNKNKTKTDI